MSKSEVQARWARDGMGNQVYGWIPSDNGKSVVDSEGMRRLMQIWQEEHGVSYYACAAPIEPEQHHTMAQLERDTERIVGRDPHGAPQERLED